MFKHEIAHHLRYLAEELQHPNHRLGWRVGDLTQIRPETGLWLSTALFVVGHIRDDGSLTGFPCMPHRGAYRAAWYTFRPHDLAPVGSLLYDPTAESPGRKDRTPVLWGTEPNRTGKPGPQRRRLIQAKPHQVRAIPPPRPGPDTDT